MRQRYLISLGALGLLAVVSWAALSLAVQNTTTAPKPATAPKLAAVSPKPATPVKPTATVPRTSWGDPDLQGTWFVLADVPLQRSPANANKEFLTDEEMAASDKQKGLNPGRNARSANSVADVDGAYNAVFNSVLKTGRRTSMIIDPPDGHLPPTVAAAAPAGGARGGRGAAPAGGARGGNQNDNPETLAQNPRCLGVQMPFIPNNTLFAQGTVMQIVQGPKSMAIYMEDDHAGGGNRVIFMDGRPHLPSGANSVLGDSRGKWDGNSLVVETTNYAQGLRVGTAVTDRTIRTIERFTRVGPNDLKREITFDDPKTWTKSWTALIEMGKTDDKRHMIFDSACHEGNYGMTGILAGARKEEAAAKK
jgi:hypothetical protein